MRAVAQQVGLDVQETNPPNPRRESENVLEALGLEVEYGPDVASTFALLHGLVTSGGHARRTRLEHCGIAYPVLDADGQLVWVRRPCRDRFCSDCGDALGRRTARAVRTRAARCDDGRVLSLALTRPKQPDETPGQALDAASKDWTRLMTSPLLRSRGKSGPPPALPGGVRMLECTARAAGEQVGQRKVTFAGIHAHLHVVAEIGKGRDPEEVKAQIVELWTAASGGVPAAQYIRAVSAADLDRACAYAMSFGAIARMVGIAPGYARAVAAAMHGRVLVRAWGTWRSCLKKAPTAYRMGDRSIAQIQANPSAPVRFGGAVWAGNDVLRAMMQHPPKLGDERGC